MFKGIDWQMFTFVGATVLKEYWVYYRLPQIYYWESHAYPKSDHDKGQKAA